VTSYIYLNKKPTVLNRSKPETPEQNTQIIEIKEFTTDTGINGNFVKEKLFYNGKIGYSFDFAVGEDEYELNSGSLEIGGTEENYLAVLNSLTFVDLASTNELKYSDAEKVNSYKFEEGDFEIQVKGDWRVERGILTNSQEPKIINLNLTKDGKTIQISQFDSTLSTSCGSLEEYIPLTKYKKVAISGKEIFVPQISKIKPEEGYSISSKAYEKVGQNSLSCGFDSGTNRYSVDIYDFSMQEKPTEKDVAMDVEIEKILQTIKW
jgi:hypothetical protein